MIDFHSIEKRVTKEDCSVHVQMSSLIMICPTDNFVEILFPESKMLQQFILESIII